MGAEAELSAGTQKVWGLQEEVAQYALSCCFSLFTETLICVAGKAALQIHMNRKYSEFHALFLKKYSSTRYVGSCK